MTDSVADTSLTDLGDSGAVPSRRLWMVNQYAVSPDMPGGSRHFELARLLHKYGWSTTIFATPFSHKTAEFLRDVSVQRPLASETIDEVDFQWLYSLPYVRNDWRRYANMLSFALALAPASFRNEKPDAVIGSSPHLLAALAAWAIAKRYKVPFLFEVRDLWPDTLVQMGLKSPLVIRVLASIERFLYEKADLVPYLTEGIGKGIQNKGVPPEKLMFLPNAALRPEPIDDAERNRIRAELGWGRDVVAIYAGAHGPANALDDVVSAARSIPESAGMRVVFVGDGPSKTLLCQQAKDLHHVTMMDPVPKSQISGLLRAADIGILSLRQTPVFEGARPNKLFDYMANGLPIVSTVGGEVKHIVESAGAGVYASPGQLASVLTDLASDPVRRAHMGSCGLDYVSSTLTREDTARILAEGLDHLTVKHRGSKS